MIQPTRRTIGVLGAAALLGLLTLGLLTACSMSEPPQPTLVVDPPEPSPTSTPTPVPTAVPTATPVPPKELTICQGQEPNTLFIYGGPSRAARNVLEAVYDGPVDTRDYALVPVILERLPSLEYGDAAHRTVLVGEGDLVVDASGASVELRPNVTVKNAAGAEVVFGGGVISMTQMVVTFTLRSDVTWADGEPLDAGDILFSYELAGELDDPALKRRIERTANYTAIDGRTVAWTGVPGYQDTHFQLNFYHPLPEHVLGGNAVDRLLETDVVRQRPLGWGPFVVESWTEGKQISLVRNPHYFRASEGLPYLDRVVFRFIQNPGEALAELLAGRCDVLAEDLMAAGGTAILAEVSDNDSVSLLTGPSSEWEHLDFGLEPAPWSGRVSFFDELRTRQAIARCVNREQIAAEAFPHREAYVATSYVSSRHPLYAGERLHTWSYDPAAGRSLLEESGWADTNGDGLLEAQDVPGIGGGTVFSVTLLTTEGDLPRQRVATMLQDQLLDCGVALEIEYLRPDVFYADGPDGPIFGRQFDLALFSWLNGVGAPCELYLSAQIPREENWWATSNNPGYASEAYDLACQSALEALYGTEAYRSHHVEAQAIFSQDLPVLPLYFVPKSVGVRQDVSGVTLNPSEPSVFSTIESFDVER